MKRPDPSHRRLERFLVRVDRRRRLRRAIAFAAWGLLVPAALACVLAVAGRADDIAAACTVAAGLVGVGALFAAGRRDLERAARDADRAAELFDLLKTTLEVGRHTPDSPWRGLLERRASSAVERLDARSLVRIAPPLAPIAAAAVLVLAAIAIPGAIERARAESSFEIAARRDLAEGAGDLAAAAGTVPQGELALPSVAAPEMPAPTERTVPTLEPGESAGTLDGAETRRSPAASLPGERSESTSDESSPEAPAATLRDERRTGEAEEAAPSGRNEKEAAAADGEDGRDGGDPASDAGRGPRRREVSDQVVALDLPAPSEGRRERGSAADAAIRSASAGSQDATPSEAPYDADEGGAAAGFGISPQEGETSPLGEATELSVTLEEVLLAATEARAAEEAATELRSMPSRRHEEALPAPRATPSAPLSGSPELERPPLRSPYPLRTRTLVREYFTPRPDTDPEDAPSEESPQ